MTFYIPTYDGKYTLEGLAQAIQSLHAEMLALYQEPADKPVAGGTEHLTDEQVAAIIAFELAHGGNEMACATAIRQRRTRERPTGWTQYIPSSAREYYIQKLSECAAQQDLTNRDLAAARAELAAEREQLRLTQKWLGEAGSERDTARERCAVLERLLRRIHSSCHDQHEPSALPRDIVGNIEATLAGKAKP